MALISIKNLRFNYPKDKDFFLNIPNFELENEQQLFLQGPSGCGKTTFLNLLTGLLKLKKGSIKILGTQIESLSSVQADSFRADQFGIIFQMFNLIPYLSVLENITLPCSFSSLRRKNALLHSSSLDNEARRLCSALDLSAELLEKPVRYLSMGQQQRVAIARAVIGKPKIIIADEASSALDPIRKKTFIQFLKQEIQAIKASLIFVSHDEALKQYFDSAVCLNELNQDSKGVSQCSF